MTTENTFATLNLIPNDLRIAKELVYDKCGFDFTNPKLIAEGKAYGACSFELNGKVIQHRVSKITPTKIGQFVTIWKRNKDGITAPFDVSDDLDFIIITVRCDDNFGQFIFPKSVLANKGIITTSGKAGKRGIRVYPPWDIARNKQAKETQSWQIKYFLAIDFNKLEDLERAKQLFL